MGVLKKLLDRAAMVKVDGEEVWLRFPTDDERFALHKALRAVEGVGEDPEQALEAVKVWNSVCAGALAATVIDDEMEEADWGRAIVASSKKNIEDESYKDLPALVDKALELCGFDPTRRDHDAEGVDRVEEVTATIGDGPS